MARRNAALPFILVTLIIDVLGIGLLIPVLPELVTELAGGDLSSGSAYYGWFIAVYAAMQFLFAPVLGGLSDRFGRRPVLLVSLLGAGLDYLVMALAPNLWILFIGRIVSGITGANITAANAYIADVSAPEERAKNFGLVGAAFGVGFILGPALGGLLAGISLRAPFYAAAAMALLNWLYGAFVLPESLAPENRRPFSWRRANPLGSLAALRKSALVGGLAFVYVCIGLAQNALNSVWVLYTGYRFGWTPFMNGLSLTLLGVVAAFVQGFLVRLIVPKVGERNAVLIGLASATVSFFLYGFSTAGWMMFAVMVIGGLGGLSGPSAQALISRAVAANEQGEVQGALASVMSLTGVVAPVVATMLFARFTGPAAPIDLPGAPLYMAAALAFVSLLVCWRLFKRVPDAGAAQPVEVAKAA
ncbi:MAG: TCR/Tet family MFS transporter [Deinococcales bacterium]|nr:TCR/Tet family MFS transporter [Deinococcales bacterium]